MDITEAPEFSISKHPRCSSASGGNAGTPITPNYPAWRNRPDEWTVYDIKTDKKVGYASKRWGFMPLPPGKYRVVLKQRYYSLPITWALVVVKKKTEKLAVRSGVTLKGRSDKDSVLYRWEVFSTRTNKKVGYASKRWGFMPLPPGDYRVELKAGYYGQQKLWRTLTIKKDRETTVAVNSGVEFTGRNSEDKPPRHWTVFESDGKTKAGHASKRWGFVALRPGKYLLQTEIGGATFLKSFTVKTATVRKLSLTDITPILQPLSGKDLVLPAAFAKKAPESPADLRAIQTHIRLLIPRIQKATVGIIVPGRGTGSGVVINSTGYVLTAAHVSRVAGLKVFVVFSDGRKVRAETLGADHKTDAGLIKVSESGKWPHVSIGNMQKIKQGDWCIAAGHPARYMPDRKPVIRLGRIIRSSVRTLFHGQIQTGAIIINGDSGGPLFDMHGRVIGINSCSNRASIHNFHTPIGAFTRNWVNLVRGNVVGSFGPSRFAIVGIYAEDHKKGCRIIDISPGCPADLAGLQPGDVITKFDGRVVKTFLGLRFQKARKRPGDTAKIEYLRDGKSMQATLTFLRSSPKRKKH